MTIEELRRLVDKAIRYAVDVDDPERAHEAEDAAMRTWIEQNAPADVLAEFHRTWDIEFPRWCG